MASKSPSSRRGRSLKRGSSKAHSKSRTPPASSSRSKSRSKSRSTSPHGSSSVLPPANPFEKAILKMLKMNLDDDEDYKSIKLSVFSDGSEWEAVVFELKINLEKVWKHSKQMDIIDYLEGI